MGALLAKLALDWQHCTPLAHAQLQLLQARAGAPIAYQHSEALALAWGASSLLVDQELLGQPWKDRDLWLIFDGALFNRTELCKELNIPESARVHALLVALWRRFGEKLLARMDGEFALILIDTQAKTALLARDRLGTRALYWRTDDQSLHIANEASWLRQPAWSINETEIARYFAVHPQSLQDTFFTGIQKVPAGTAVILKGNRTQTFEFAKSNIQPLRYADPISTAEQIKSLLRQSINKRVNTNVPIAASLSGGIDSNLVLAIAKQAGIANLSAVTWGFDALAECEESNFAKDHATHINMPFHRIKADGLGMFSDPNLRSTSLNAPFNHPYRELLHAVRVRAKENGVQALLHGAYGDTQFFHKTELLTDQWQRSDWFALVSSLTSALSAQLNPLQNPSIRRLLRHLAGRKLQVIGNYFELSAYAKELLGKPPSIRSFRDWQLDSCLGATAQLNAEFEPEYSERMGIQTIYPLRDWDVMHLMLSLPVDFGHRDGTNKWIWREMMRDQIPPNILNRPKSTSLTPFFNVHIQRMRPLLSTLLGAPDADFGRFVDANHIRAQLGSTYTEFEGAVIWRCISYELWRMALGLRAPVPGLF
jgi:asparagine synthetase B (glutamine-hydrolysing)